MFLNLKPETLNVKQIFFIFLLLYFPLSGRAQVPYPLNHGLNLKLENKMGKSNKDGLNSLKPLYPFDYMKRNNLDSLLYPEIYQDYHPKNTSWLSGKLFYEELYRKDSANIQMEINPALNIKIIRNPDNPEKMVTNTRGIRAYASFYDRVYISTQFYENQSFYPDYLDNYVKEKNIAPGQGRVKPFKERGYDYTWSAGQILYRPDKNHTINIGHGKKFLGNGYRSLLLSDVPFHFPYLQYKYKNENFQYSKTIALLRSDLYPDHGIEPGQHKSGVFHYISKTIGKNLEVGFFEANMVQNPDSSGRYSFYWGYANPLPLLNSLLPYNNIEVNSLAGINIKYLPNNTLQLYGQMALNAFTPKKWFNGKGDFTEKLGGQLGFKLFEPLGINNLIWFSELNAVRPYTYGYTTPRLSFSHYNQSLAHPFGANFIENVNGFYYNHKRIALKGKMVYSKYGKNMNNKNVGKNIFQFQENLNPNKSQFLQGLKTELLFTDLEIGYIINPEMKLKIFIRLQKRIEHNKLNYSNNTFYTLGINTFLINRYYDF
jgi:hypothetical protein